MFDTMTLTKIVGGLGGALLVFLLGSWLASAIYGFYPAEEGYAEGEEARQGYVIATSEGPADEAAPEASEEELIAEFQTAFAAADAGAGEAVFGRQCAGCHSLAPGENKTGPYLAGIVGRPADAAEGYDYSGALEQVVDVWDENRLSFFIEDPQDYAPGTKMTFRGIPDLQDRANLIAYLAQQ